MASSPRWKVYSADNEYMASCKEIEAAAAVVSMYGENATIRDGHTRVVWREGDENDLAGNSYDWVVMTVLARTAKPAAT